MHSGSRKYSAHMKASFAHDPPVFVLHCTSQWPTPSSSVSLVRCMPSSRRWISSQKKAQVAPLIRKYMAWTRATRRTIGQFRTWIRGEDSWTTGTFSFRSARHNFAEFRSNAISLVYRRRHLTETTLLKITNDIYQVFDNRQLTILVALDQSCIDRPTSISRLQHTFRVTRRALDCMAVVIPAIASGVCPLEWLVVRYIGCTAMTISRPAVVFIVHHTIFRSDSVIRFDAPIYIQLYFARRQQT